MKEKEGTQTVAPFEKIVRPGTVKVYPGRADLFCKIKWDGKRLSITGVEGPTRNGDCKGSCGQCGVDPEETEPSPGWDKAMLAEFAGIWDRWHLNDMRAGCEHQRADGWGKKELEIITYELTGEALQRQRKIKSDAMDTLRKTGAATMTDEERDFLALEWRTTNPRQAHLDLYKVKSTEKKRSGWVRETEHPDGELSKPCPTCGYKYGTQWLTEEVPASVIEWLKALPDTDKTPEWV